ncbi:hypothetical protein PG985_004894 [Apiospora marii]|uniref:uncharacterized protein n=1 Tax=Apiospora marii TaxID=335849 RepID=UPI00312E11A5
MATATARSLVPSRQGLREQVEDLQTDKPVLLRAAESHGARHHGVCKIVLPEELRAPLPTRASSPPREHCSIYTPESLGDGFWRLDPQLSRQVFRRSDCESERVEDLHPRLRPGQALEDVAYATDVPASTGADRKSAGLPLESPIAQLGGDHLGTTRHRLAGMHSVAKFEGMPGAPFCWHIEHCGTCSFNYMYSGEKEWHVIPPASRRETESVFRALPLSKAAQTTCPQFIRHDAIFGTEGLAHIPMRTFRQFAGEIVVVFPDAYHSGHTVAYSIADARNYADDKWSISEADCCRRSCPDGSIEWRHMRPRGADDQIGEDDDENDEDTIPASQQGRKKRFAQDTPPKPPKASKIRKTRHGPDETAEVDEEANSPDDVAQVVAQVRKVDSLCSIPLLQGSPPTPEILRLASAIRSRATIGLFRSLVKEWRAVKSSSQVVVGENRLQCFVKWIDDADQSRDFAVFRRRLGQARLAAELDSTVPNGFKKLDVDKRQNKMKELKWDKQRFEHQLAEGRKWNRFCGEKFQGIMGFIFITHHNQFDIAPRRFLELGSSEEKASKTCRELHTLLDDHYTHALCKVGTAFESALLDGNPTLVFKWETLPDSPDWTTLPEPELLSYMQPYEPVTTNVYRPTEYPDWPRPGAWPDKWVWPANPLSEGVAGCDYCPQRDCECLTRPPKSIPSIRHYGRKGLGLQAAGSTPGRVVYKKNDTIGWLLGKIIPPNVLENPGGDRRVEFARPDIPGEPVVCHLECLDSSNLFRLLNHDCNPVAQLKPRKVSSQYVLAVVAKQDIMDGSEITIRYSQKHYGLNCLCGTCEGRKKRTPLPNEKAKQ